MVPWGVVKNYHKGFRLVPHATTPDEIRMSGASCCWRTANALDCHMISGLHEQRGDVSGLVNLLTRTRR